MRIRVRTLRAERLRPPYRASSIAPAGPSARATPPRRSPKSSTPRVWLHLKLGQKGTKRLATEAYLIERVGELEQSLYREKPRIMVAEGAGLQWLLERLVEKYETEEGLADHLHVEMFTQLPEILRRARKVRPLVLGQEVPLGLSRRYREAVQSYLSGHAIACCVLLRAVVETALKEALERHTGERVSFDYRTLGPLIDDSEKFRLFPGEIVKRCREIKRLGDNAAHDDRVLALNEAHEALAATQQVLKCVFQGTIGSAPPPG